MKSKVLIAVAATLFASGAAYAAVQAMGCCDDCCDEMRQHHGEHGTAQTPAPAPAPQH